jgi:hypothetical protein
MAVAAWPKISLLASNWTYIYHQDLYGNKYNYGAVKCQVIWSRADPPPSSTEKWEIVFVTSTIAYLNLTEEGPGDVEEIFTADAPLKITAASSTTSFQFQKNESTVLLDTSETSWQKIIRGAFWIIVGVILTPVSGGSWWAPYVITIGLGVAQTITDVAFESQSLVENGKNIDLALSDLSNIEIFYQGNGRYSQLQSFGVTKAYFSQLPNGGAFDTLTFKIGQRATYQLILATGIGLMWDVKGIVTFQRGIKVEPFFSGDCNKAPQTPQAPSGTTSGYRYATYTYSTSTIDPEGDDVRYIFYWGDKSNTTTGYYESGNTVSVSHQWNSPGTYVVYVQAQDCQGANTLLSQGLTVTIANRAPNTPSPPSGPTAGYTGTSYSYSTNTTDPDGDDVYYQFDWNDSSTVTIGPYKSGSKVSASHTWSSPGTYYVKVRAKDSYEAWSNWSRSLTVTISTSSSGGGGGGCPTLFSWNGTGYAEEALLDIHASQDVTVDYKLKYLEPAGKLCMLSLRELDNYTSHIDYVKLYAVDAEGNWHECRLILALHNELGPVTAQLSSDDDIRINLEPTQRIELLFKLPNDINNIQYFIFELNGYNVKALLT